MLKALADGVTAMGRNDVFIENMHFISLLENAYRDQNMYSESRSYEWLCQRAEELVTGNRRYLASQAVS